MTADRGEVIATSNTGPGGQGVSPAGLVRQRQLVNGLAAKGRTVIGWKAGLGSPAARATLGLSAPLVGVLLDTSRRRPGTTVDVSSWVAPHVEAEVAVRLARDLPARTSPREALSAVRAVAPAIELVDLDRPATDPDEVVATNIYHRAWLTGPFAAIPGPFRLDGSTMHVRSSRASVDAVQEIEALTGGAGDILTEVARIAAQLDRGLRAGDVVILGAVVPPRAIVEDGGFEVALDDRPPLRVRLRRDR